MIEYQDVWKRFEHPVLTGVDLRVNTGEIASIVGPSGTGKSVLLKTTIGLIRPDRGRVVVDGEVVDPSDASSIGRLREKAAYVFQNAALFDSMSVFDNVLQGLPQERVRGLDRRSQARLVGEALEHVNLEPARVLARFPAELSGGMRKRVGIARAIVGEPSILLYDEPVTGLDPVNADVIHELITRLARDLSATSILVTHDVEGALAISNHVALLSGGRIRFVGTPQEFKYSDNSQVRAFTDRRIAGTYTEEAQGR
ncbi:MAG TPA: ATP-binding cassette domain-containing protein [Longimicrobiales bacterium]|nr:ATP-binding cassette domain-containing protein [Longimicrobiales bacterium]